MSEQKNSKLNPKQSKTKEEKGQAFFQCIPRGSVGCKSVWLEPSL